MRTDESERLTITSVTWIGWLFALFFAAVGVLFLVTLPENRVGGIVMLAVGIALGMFAGRVNRLTLDRQAETATLRQIGLLGRTRVVPLAEVSGAIVESSGPTQGSSSACRVALVLRSGARLPLNSMYESGVAAKNAQAERINQFLGTDAPKPELAFGSGPGAMRQDGVTDGVAWQIEARVAGPNTPVTRWHSAGAGLQDGLLLVLPTQHKVGGVGANGGLMASVARLGYEGILLAHGYNPTEIPGLTQAVSVEGQDPALAEHFVTFTTRPEAARGWLTAEVCQILIAWAERHPAKILNTDLLVTLSIVTAPFGLWLTILGDIQDSTQIEEMTRLGVALVRARPAVATAELTDARP